MPWILLTSLACIESKLTEHVADTGGPGVSCAPNLDVDASVDFGDVRVGEAHTLTLVLGNTGDCPLHLDAVSLDSASFSAGAISSVVVPPQAEASIELAFEPQRWGEDEAWLALDSNDEDVPHAMVQLTGLGIAPEIHLDPTVLDLGVLNMGCEREAVVTVSNQGNDTLEVSQLQLVSAGVDIVLEDSEPFALAPGQEQALWLTYSPLDLFDDEALLQVTSNDPVHPFAQSAITAAGSSPGAATDLYQQSERKPVDILFALDKSGSMSDDVASVGANMQTFLTALAGADADYQVAAIVQDSGCVFGSTPAITSDMDSTHALSVWDTMVSGPAGMNTERGLSLIEAATTASCNAGLVRDDATLAVVLVSDEPEQSVSPYTSYIAGFQGLKDDPDDVVIHAVGGDYPNGCGSAFPYTGAYESTVATGGLFLSICASDWGSNLEQLAEASLVIRDDFPLSEQPVPETVEVFINGIPAWGWTYEAADNTVLFSADAAPEAGADIRIDYHLLGECD